MSEKVHIRAVDLIPRWGCVTASGELADSANPAHENHVIGVTEGKIDGSPARPMWGDATISGTVFDKDWTWTPGGIVFLNGTVLSQTPPGGGNFTQIVGHALTAQHLLINGL